MNPLPPIKSTYSVMPSILDKNLMQLESFVQNLQTQGLKNPFTIRMMHMDVMDGHFVSPLTFGEKFVQDFSQISPQPLDVHLMISNPLTQLKKFFLPQIHRISFHYEALENPHLDIPAAKQSCQEANIHLGIAIKPHTAWEVLIPHLDQLDFVLIMTVEPGFGGQKAILDCFEKVSHLYEWKKTHQLPFLLQVDGGIHMENIFHPLLEGVDDFVVGSSLEQFVNLNSVK